MMSKKITIPVTPADLPHNFKRIRLDLAREKAHPQGSRNIGYTLVAPLDDRHHIDVDLWRKHRDACRVVRFRPNEESDVGHLIHRPGGSWAFHYDIRGDEPDEAGYRFQSERFVPGEYVSIHEEDGPHTFRVVTVESALS
jgi:hypothetical protein